MSKFVNKVKDAMTDHNKDAPTAHGFQAPHDENASSNFPTTEYDPNQHKSSSMNESSGMGSNNPYESGAPSDDGPGTYHRDSKFTGWSPRHLVHCTLYVFHDMLIVYVDSKSPPDPSTTGRGDRGGRSDPGNHGSTRMGGNTLTSTSSAGQGNINAGPHDSKLTNKMDPRVDSDLGKTNQISFVFIARKMC
jgi:hypothetical protein